MRNFAYVRANALEEATHLVGNNDDAALIAGGTNLVDLMKYDVQRPSLIVDISRLDMRRITELAHGGLRIGALVTNSELAYDPIVSTRYPVLSRAILAGASAQIRNRATTGGNLLQRTRCVYFYDVATNCNKREPGSGCPARVGSNREMAILGTSPACIATHPSDMCVALAALGANVQVTGPEESRTIRFMDFHRLPGDRPDLDSTLRKGEMITSVDLPPSRFSGNSAYVKVRDRQSYAFALISVAVGLEIGDGFVKSCGVAIGGVAHKPWRDAESEAELLIGKPATRNTWHRFQTALLKGAQGFGENDFKLRLAPAVIVRALEQAAHEGDKE